MNKQKELNLRLYSYLCYILIPGAEIHKFSIKEHLIFHEAQKYRSIVACETNYVNEALFLYLTRGHKIATASGSFMK